MTDDSPQAEPVEGPPPPPERPAPDPLKTEGKSIPDPTRPNADHLAWIRESGDQGTTENE